MEIKTVWVNDIKENEIVIYNDCFEAIVVRSDNIQSKFVVVRNQDIEKYDCNLSLWIKGHFHPEVKLYQIKKENVFSNQIDAIINLCHSIDDIRIKSFVEFLLEKFPEEGQKQILFALRNRLFSEEDQKQILFSAKETIFSKKIPEENLEEIPEKNQEEIPEEIPDLSYVKLPSQTKKKTAKKSKVTSKKKFYGK